MHMRLGEWVCARRSRARRVTLERPHHAHTHSPLRRAWAWLVCNRCNTQSRFSAASPHTKDPHTVRHCRRQRAHVTALTHTLISFSRALGPGSTDAIRPRSAALQHAPAALSSALAVAVANRLPDVMHICSAAVRSATVVKRPRALPARPTATARPAAHPASRWPCAPLPTRGGLFLRMDFGCSAAAGCGAR